MRVINTKLVFNRFLLTLGDILYFTFFFLEILRNDFKDYGIILLFVTFIFKFCYIIGLIAQLYLYLDNFGKIFENLNDIVIWEKNFFSFKFRNVCLVTYNIGYFLISLLISPILRPSSDYTFTINFLIYIITTLTIGKCIIAFGSIFIYSIFIIRQYYNSFRRRPIENREIEMINIIIDENENCSICLDSEKKEWIKLSCNHSFHKDCINMWVATNRTCPVCRVNL